MSFQKLSKYGSVLCGKHDHVARILRSEAESLQGKQVSSASFVVSGHRNSHSSAGSRQQLRIEGIQGPIPAQLSANESKRLLESASIQAAGGFSKRGVQDCQLHTDQVHHSSASHSYRATDWELDDTACPQGVQGSADLGAGCAHFNTWLENCRRYGLANCDQQLQGIQSGRLTLAQVLADQEVMITEIAESYRKRTEELPDVADESMQGAQGQLRLPEVSAPCPQGIQGDDCVRFKLWLENCHRFGIHECMQQLQGFQSGRLTLAQLFIQQDAMIRQVAQQYQQRRQYSTQPRGDNSNATSTTTDAQVGDATTTQQLSQAEKLKRAVKEYGSTVIVFHITISLASLGGFYLAVSRSVVLNFVTFSVAFSCVWHCLSYHLYVYTTCVCVCVCVFAMHGQGSRWICFKFGGHIQVHPGHNLVDEIFSAEPILVFLWIHSQ
ncbi:uncharacterized protein [Littorina saxatilis]|uniref:uncharacterized protein n=1 Tax=Littorina saxatilis TaxID=31220 RepID=UPI0038B4DEDF